MTGVKIGLVISLGFAVLAGAGPVFCQTAQDPWPEGIDRWVQGYGRTISGETISYQMVVSVEAIELGGLHVEGERRCEVHPGVGLRTATVWEEARKALSATRWTQETQPFSFRVVRYRRELDPRTRGGSSICTPRWRGRLTGFLWWTPRSALGM